MSSSRRLGIAALVGVVTVAGLVVLVSRDTQTTNEAVGSPARGLDGPLPAADAADADACRARMDDITFELVAISDARTTMGAWQNRLASGIANLQTQSEAISAGRPRIAEPTPTPSSDTLSPDSAIVLNGDALREALPSATSPLHGALSRLRGSADDATTDLGMSVVGDFQTQDDMDAAHSARVQYYLAFGLTPLEYEQVLQRFDPRARHSLAPGQTRDEALDEAVKALGDALNRIQEADEFASTSADRLTVSWAEYRACASA